MSVKQGPWLSLAFNLAFAISHGALGVWMRSWWYINLMTYYVLLSIMRFVVLRGHQKENSQQFLRKFTGIMLMILPICLTGTIILCTIKDRGVRHHEIIMIAIALYAFVKVTLAIINLVKAARLQSNTFLCLRNISLADALVSIYSLQRSMLVSFGDMSERHITLFNLLTGSGLSLTVFLLGLNLSGGKRITMAKSKIVKANEKIAQNVVKGYNAIEKGVVNSYKAVEKHVVEGFCKIEDKFVDRYLTREGETVEEAKKRLKEEQK